MNNQLTSAEMETLRQHMPEEDVKTYAWNVEHLGRAKVLCPYISENGDFSEAELKALEKQGVHRDSLHKIGKGGTRVAYRGIRLIREPFMTQTIPVTVTLPNQAETPDSVNSAMAMARGDMDLQEFDVLSNMGWHPNIVSSSSSISPNGRRINLNGYAEGTDLESLIKANGPLKNGKAVKEVARQLLSGLGYVHQQGYLHRDLKPSNVFVDPAISDGRYLPEAVKIGDFQIAIPINQVEERTLPTRGSAEYSHRSLLNAIVTDKPAKATEKTDLYSLGGILYFTLTGKAPSGYKVIRDDNGREVKVNDKTFRISLVRRSTNSDVKLERIEDEAEEARLKDIVKDVPISSRRLVYGCLTDNPDYAFQTVEEARSYMEKPLYHEMLRVGKKILRKIKAYIPRIPEQMTAPVLVRN